jgi:hypothetical protein
MARILAAAWYRVAYPLTQVYKGISILEIAQPRQTWQPIPAVHASACLSRGMEPQSTLDFLSTTFVEPARQTDIKHKHRHSAKAARPF